MARLSTVVDRRERRPAAATRAVIVAAARIAFCRAGFDRLGVRELAAAADVDPAIVIRLFGSKEALFAAVAATAFTLEAPFVGPAAGLGVRIARHLTGKVELSRADDFDALAFLVRSAGSAVAAPILSAALHAGFVEPLATVLGGADAHVRATLLASIVLGFSTLRVALGSPVLEASSRTKLAMRLGAALQACVDA